MKFKIDFDIEKQPIENDWPSFYMIGSCFASEQAVRMQQLNMNVHTNPFGTLYNPISIEDILNRVVSNQKYEQDDFQKKEQYFSWEHHGKYKYDSLQEAITTSNEIIELHHKALTLANVCVITLGTSIVFKHQQNVVANCHKIPNKEFTQVQLTCDQVNNSIHNQIALIRTINESANIIITVSPIRHLRSGVTENMRSKAVLISQIHEVLDDLNDRKLSYFPAYEIFTDELRDYRFAKEDLTHPTAMASKYIWEKFAATYFNHSCLKTLEDLEKLNKLINHKPTDNIAHSEAVLRLRKKLKIKYPTLSLT